MCSRGIVIAAVVLLAPVMCYSADSIGLYFDENYTINCMPDTTGLVVVEAYLVIKNYSGGQGVQSWEGAFSITDNVIYGLYNLGSNATNFASFPEFIVGYSEPLAVSNEVVLGSFTFIFLGPGEVYFHSPLNDTAGSPYLPTYSYIGESIDMEYDQGSPIHPIACVGTGSCPVDSVPQSNYIPEPPSWTRVDVSQYNVLYQSSDPPPSSKQYETDIERWSLSYDVGFLGHIDSIEIVPYANENWRIGAALMKVTVGEELWGEVSGQVDVICEGVDIPGYLVYEDYSEFSFAEGDSIILAAKVIGGALVTNREHVVPGDEIRSNKISTTLVKVASGSTVGGKFDRADLVVLCQRASVTHSSLTPMIIYKNSTRCDAEYIALTGEGCEIANYIRPRNEELCYLFLRAEEDCGFTLLGSSTGIYMVDAGSVKTVNGLPRRLFK